MSCRKKIGWRGPLRELVSVMSGALLESLIAFGGCGAGAEPPKARSAARPPAPTPPSTNAIVRIIDPTLRRRRSREFASAARGRSTREAHQVVRGPKYSPAECLHNPSGAALIRL